MREDGVGTPGLYDAVFTRRLAREVVGLDPELAELDGADQPDRFAQHVADVLAAHLSEVDEGERARLVAALVAAVGRADEQVEEPPRLLVGIPTTDALGLRRLAERPEIPLSTHDLLVNGRGEPHLAAELKKEIASADQIDLIVAFVAGTAYASCLMRSRKLAATMYRSACSRRPTQVRPSVSRLTGSPSSVSRSACPMTPR